MTSAPTSPSLVERVRALLACQHTQEKRMFGGVTFLVSGNMLCCVSKNGLMVRVGKDAEETALSRPHAAPCLGTGRRMAGFILVQPAGIESDVDLRSWLSLARAYVEPLPVKPGRVPSTASSGRRGPKTKRRPSSASSRDKGEA